MLGAVQVVRALQGLLMQRAAARVGHSVLHAMQLLPGCRQQRVIILPAPSCCHPPEAGALVHQALAQLLAREAVLVAQHRAH